MTKASRQVHMATTPSTSYRVGGASVQPPLRSEGWTPMTTTKCAPNGKEIRACPVQGYWVTKDGEVWGAPMPGSRREWRLRKLGNNNNGRPIVSLFENSRGKSYQVSRLVAMAWIPNPENHPWVLHRDDNPLNNQLDNLYWGTLENNVADKMRNGTASGPPRGRKYVSLKPEQVCAIRRAKGVVGVFRIARDYGVSVEAIYNIWKGVSWKNVVCDTEG